MPDEPQKLEYATPPPAVSRRNARASISFWMSICFPALFLFTASLGGLFAGGIIALAGDRLPPQVAIALAGLVGGVCTFWPVAYSLISGIRAVGEIAASRESGLWQAIVGIVVSSLFALIPLLAILRYFLRL